MLAIEFRLTAYPSKSANFDAPDIALAISTDFDRLAVFRGAVAWCTNIIKFEQNVFRSVFLLQPHGIFFRPIKGCHCRRGTPAIR